MFPGGPPSKYYPGPTMLNFRDLTRTGVFIEVWSYIAGYRLSNSSTIFCEQVLTMYLFLENFFYCIFGFNYFFYFIFFFQVMCRSNRWLTNPPTGQGRDITKHLAPTTGLSHTVFFPTSGYHHRKMPDPGINTSNRVGTSDIPGGGLVNHRFERHITYTCPPLHTESSSPVI